MIKWYVSISLTCLFMTNKYLDYGANISNISFYNNGVYERENIYKNKTIHNKTDAVCVNLSHTRCINNTLLTKSSNNSIIATHRLLLSGVNNSKHCSNNHQREITSIYNDSADELKLYDSHSTGKLYHSTYTCYIHKLHIFLTKLYLTYTYMNKRRIFIYSYLFIQFNYFMILRFAGCVSS